MNAIDIFLLAILFGGMIVGFTQGVVRVGIMFFAFYLSVVLAGLYFPPVGRWVQSTFGAPTLVAQYVAFFIVALIAFFALTFAGVYTLRYVEVPARFALFDKLIGVFLGLVLAALIAGLVAMLLWNLMIVRDGRSLNAPLLPWLGRQVFSSVLLRLLASGVLPAAYDLVSPFLPASARFLLSPLQ